MPARMWPRMVQYQAADQAIFAMAQSLLGLDQVRALISGAAPINPEVLRFLHAIGLRVGEVYGQTEDTGPTSINPPDRIKIGTVGPPVPGLEVKIAEDGEILVRGGNVGPGYFKNPEATAELLDGEGWMHSGDVGELDEDGYLRITDRKKDLIITAAGKNIAPQVIENMLKHSPWISQSVVIGDGRPFLTALLTLDEEKVTAFAEQKSISFSGLGRRGEQLRDVARLDPPFSLIASSFEARAWDMIVHLPLNENDQAPRCRARGASPGTDPGLPH